MARKFVAFSFFITILLLSAHTNRLQAQPAAEKAVNFTIPTRTPTSAPVTPTNPPPTNPPSNPGNPAPPTNTPLPTATTSPIPAPPTPEGGILPTAEPCSSQPTVLALNPNFINVRSGPGTDYEVVNQLVYGEVRLIIGRAGDAAWWHIQLPAGNVGWVANDVVLIHGNTAQVPIVASPNKGDATVTPGAPWEPTPRPVCPTPTPVISPTQEADSNSDKVIIVSPPDMPTETPPAAEGSSYPADAEQPIQTNVKPLTAVTPTPTATAIVLPTSIAAVPEPAAADPPAVTPTDNANTGYTGLLLLGAAGLVILGLTIMLFKRRTL